jgi:hypothetical protein
MATSSNYNAIIDGLVAVLKTVDGVQNVLDYEPQAFGATPLIYLILGDYQLTDPANQEMLNIFNVAMRVVIQYTNNQTAEQTLRTLFPAILDTLGANLSMGQTDTDGQVLITSAKAGYVTSGGAKYRCLDCILQITENANFTWSL